MAYIERKWVPVPRNSKSLQLGDKMYWHQPESQFIVLVKGHSFVKSIVSDTQIPPNAKILTQDGFSTYILLDDAERSALEQKASDAYAAGFDRFDQWQLLFKSKATRPGSGPALVQTSDENALQN